MTTTKELRRFGLAVLLTFGGIAVILIAIQFASIAVAALGGGMSFAGMRHL